MAKPGKPPASVGPRRTRTRAKRQVMDPQQVRQEVLRLIMEGKTTREIGAIDGLPCKATIMNWLAADPDFRAGYAAAKALYAETLAEEIIEISDDAAADWVDSDTGGRELDHEHVQRSRLRVDSRKWLAARLSPKRYGDSSMLKIGEMDNAPRKELTPTEIAARLAALSARINKGEIE